MAAPPGLDEETVRAYQLLDVLLHELGHHHDRMTTGSQKRPARGETYAEQYAAQYAERIWDAYSAEFELVIQDSDERSVEYPASSDTV